MTSIPVTMAPAPMETRIRQRCWFTRHAGSHPGLTPKVATAASLIWRQPRLRSFSRARCSMPRRSSGMATALDFDLLHRRLVNIPRKPPQRRRTSPHSGCSTCSRTAARTYRPPICGSTGHTEGARAGLAASAPALPRQHRRGRQRAAGSTTTEPPESKGSWSRAQTRSTHRGRRTWTQVTSRETTEVIIRAVTRSLKRLGTVGIGAVPIWVILGALIVQAALIIIVIAIHG